MKKQTDIFNYIETKHTSQSKQPCYITLWMSGLIFCLSSLVGCSGTSKESNPVAPVDVQEVVISSPVSCIDASKVPSKPDYILIKKSDNEVDKMIALKHNNNLYPDYEKKLEIIIEGCK
jgi:hypothetical protein